MVNIKMIDTQGYGIHKMFESQKKRYLPMPDYDKSTDAEVVLTLPGTIIDENYSLILLKDQNLTLTDAVLLDSVQKRKSISSDAVAMLRKRKLIEGRLPHIYIAKNIAQATDKKIEYSRHKGLDDKKCVALLLDVYHCFYQCGVAIIFRSLFSGDILAICSFEKTAIILKRQLVFVFCNDDTCPTFISLMSYCVVKPFKNALSVIFPNFGRDKRVLWIYLKAIIPYPV